jgi:glycosyltransferase involved in cell wall biosynthesis
LPEVTSLTQTPKRHCMVVFAPYPLGETRVQREAEALVNHGYAVDVICIRLPGDPVIDEYKGVRIYREKHHPHIPFAGGGPLFERFLQYLRFFLSAAVRLTRLHLRRPYSSIQVHNLPDFLVFCALIPKVLGAPVILDLHDLMPEFYLGCFGHPSSLAARLICLQEKLACRFADHVITVSKHWRQALIRRGVPGDKCSVVMNVADDQIFRPSNGDCHHKRPQDRLRLIYHGSIHRRYGLDLAVQAIHRVRHEIPGIHLTLVGKGEFLPCLQEMINGLHLWDHITVEPLCLAEQLPAMICSCDLGVVPYRADVFTDGLLPTKLMEYAALGMPAVAARTTAIQAYFSDANVEFFEPGNVDDFARCIVNLYHNPDRIAALGRGSQNFNRRYSWSEISEEYVSLVERLQLGTLRLSD